MADSERSILSELKRELRQEALFGCVLCGSPIIEFHHIEFFSVVHEHKKENLVVLCPKCHHRANCKEIPPDYLLQKKVNPFNKDKSDVSQEFFPFIYNDMIIKMSGGEFIRTPELITVRGKRLLYLVEDNGFALINAKFYSKDNTLLAEIRNNEWIAHRPKQFWDIEYSPGHLKINSEKNKILVEFVKKDNLFELKGVIYYMGKKISIEPSKIVVSDINCKKNRVVYKSCSVTDCKSAFFIK